MKQVKEKSFLIAKVHYYGYSFLFLFDNIINYLVYSINTL